MPLCDQMLLVTESQSFLKKVNEPCSWWACDWSYLPATNASQAADVSQLVRANRTPAPAPWYIRSVGADGASGDARRSPVMLKRLATPLTELCCSHHVPRFACAVLGLSTTASCTRFSW